MGFQEEWRGAVVAADRVPDVGVAVGRDGGPVWTAGSDRLFQACSISKHVAAYGTLRLAAEGRIDLDADVNDGLTSWRLPGPGTVTVRQLLAHTAGLTENWYPGYPAGTPVPSLRQILDGAPPANTPPVRRDLSPGSAFRYSGSHYAVLQQLLTDVTGTPFDELMAALVLGPAGMADSSFDQDFPYARPDRAARGHRAGAPIPGGFWHTQPEMAAAGLWTTPADLVRLELAILRATTAEPFVQMLTPQVSAGYGLGTELGPGRFGHTGENTGYRCFSFVWPATGTAVAVMTNGQDARPTLSALFELAARTYGPGPVPMLG